MSVLHPIDEDPRYRISTATFGQTAFTVPFYFQDNADITVLRFPGGEGSGQILDEGDDYFLSGAGVNAGGTVTLALPAEEGDVFIRIGRAVLDRVTDVTINGRFRSKAIDDDLDRMILIAQEIHRELGRTLRTAYGVPGVEVDVGGDNTLPVWRNGRLEQGPVWAEELGIPGPGVPVGGTPGQILAKGSIADYDGTWVTTQQHFATPAQLLADTDMGYSVSAAIFVFAGAVLWGGPHSYQVAASDAADHHLTTAGGVKLYVLPGAIGYSFAAMNPAADGVTDDYPKLAKLLAGPITGTGFYQSTPAVFFPNGNYYMAQTIELKRSTKLWGFSSGLPNDAAATLIFPVDTTGIIINRYNTLNGGVEGVPTTAADATSIEGLRLKSTVGTDLTKHGIWLRARAAIRNVFITAFSGNGINILASSGGGGAVEGNANCFAIDTVRAENCGGHGVYAQGADANAGHGINIDASSNRLWGIFDNSFLGNTWSGCHVADNGRDTVNARSAYASYGGVTYHAVPGVSSATLGATQPGTDATKWRPCNTTSYAIAWTGANPAGTYRDGGGYRSANVNARVLFSGCYVEAGQGLTWLSPQSIAVGGFLVECPVASGAGAHIEGRSNATFTTGYFRSNGTDAGGTKKVDVSVGGDPTNGDVLKFSGQDGATVTGDWRLKRDGDGWALNYANLTNALRLTGATETYPTSLQAPTRLVLGVGGTARAFGRVTYSTTSGIVLPSSGTYAKGDAYLAPNPNAGDFIGFVCTTGGIAGSTAVFKNFGAISA